MHDSEGATPTERVRTHFREESGAAMALTGVLSAEPFRLPTESRDCPA